MKLLLDTCALVWWVFDPDRLSPPASDAIAKAGEIAVSSISIWELGIKVKRRKLELPLSVREFTERLNRSGLVEIIPVTAPIWLKNLDLDWEHRDPADRTIVATATLRAIPIVTADTTIAGFYQPVVW